MIATNPVPRIGLYDRLLLVTAFLILLFAAVAGPLRYYLVSMHLIVLAYAPQAMMIVMLAVYPGVRGAGVYRRAYLGIATIVGFYVLVGIIFTGNIKQVAFGLYEALPFFLGILAYEPFLATQDGLPPYFIFLFILAVTGVLYDVLYTPPWVGLSYILAGKQVIASRPIYSPFIPRNSAVVHFLGLFSHQSDGGGYVINRVAGFARASYSAAMQLLLLSCILVTTNARRAWRLTAWLIGGATIFFTTTKGILVAYLLCSTVLLLWNHMPRRAWRSLLLLLLLLVITVPLSALLYRWQFVSNKTLSRLLVFSLQDRLDRSYPDAINILAHHGSLILGRGIGGIGASQAYFEPGLYLAPDNLFVFLYVTFGLGGLAMLIAYAAGALYLDPAGSTVERYFYLIAASFLAYGITTSDLESSYFALFAGLSAAHMYRKVRGRLADSSGRLGTESTDRGRASGAPLPPSHAIREGECNRSTGDSATELLRGTQSS